MFAVLPVVHIVPVPSSLSDQEFTFFQGFSREVIDSCAWIIEAIGKSPLSYLELFATDDEFVRIRSSGCALMMQMAQESLLLRDAEHIGDYFSVIWSSRHTSRLAALIVDRMIWRPIHVSSDPDVDAIRPESLTPEVFHRLLMEKADALVERDDVDVAVKSFIQGVRVGVPRYTSMRKFPFSVANHFSVDPAVMTLRSFGYFQDNGEELEPVGEDHVSYILDYARRVDELRERVNLRADLGMSDGLIFCPVMYAGLYKSSGKVWKDIGRKLARAGRKFLVSGFVRNKGYSRITFSSNDASDVVGDPYLTVLLKEKGMELWFLARVVGLASASQCIASIRLPKERFTNNLLT